MGMMNDGRGSGWNAVAVQNLARQAFYHGVSLPVYRSA